jgi:hypothetical protein
MFTQMNPLSRQSAFIEIALMLIGAFILGYLYARRCRKCCCDNCQCQEAGSVGAVANDDGSTKDDLKVIEGIGPAIEKLLNDAGIHTFAHLASAPESKLTKILEGAGKKFAMHSTETWGEQAALARDGKWDALDELMEKLTAGRKT